jgi:mannosyl-3-phosphoglycerate phosphatase family protein
MRLVIFTDLDGTLLDPDYSFEAALPALEELRRREIPLVICSSKTRGEIEAYRLRLGNRHPFISENGGGIFIPRGYFPFPCPDSLPCGEEGEYRVIVLGTPYVEVRRGIRSLREKGFTLRGFGDMTYEEIMAATGLDADGTALAGEREYDEPFVFSGTREEGLRLREAARAEGLRVTPGKFYHLHGETDKGRGVTVVASLYRRAAPSTVTVALGDGPTDLSMLLAVDRPLAIPRADASIDPALDRTELPRAAKPGPEGWNLAVLELLERLDPDFPN